MSSAAVYYGIGTHGCEIHCTKNGGASCNKVEWFKLPDNVKLITVAYPGKDIGGVDFLPMYYVIKSLTDDQLKVLFSEAGTAMREDMKGYFMRLSPQYSSTFSVRLYSLKTSRGLAPDLILDSLVCHDHPKFQRFKKNISQDVWRHGRRPYQAEEVVTANQRKNVSLQTGHYYVTPIFVSRRQKNLPIPPRSYADVDDDSVPIRALSDPFVTQTQRAKLPTRIDTAQLYWDVDTSLMKKYFDCKTLLSTFIQKECTDPTKKYNVLVMACRGPVTYDTTKVAHPMGPQFADTSANYEQQMLERNNRPFEFDPRGVLCWKIPGQWDLYALYVKGAEFLIDSALRAAPSTNGPKLILDMIRSFKSCSRGNEGSSRLKDAFVRAYFGGHENLVIMKGGTYELKKVPPFLFPRVYGQFVGVVSVSPPSSQQDFVFIHNVTCNKKGFFSVTAIHPLEDIIKYIYGSNVKRLKLYVEEDSPEWKAAGFKHNTTDQPNMIMEKNLH